VKTRKESIEVLEKKANWLRERFGYSSADPIAPKTVLMQMGVLALFRPMSSSFSGMALKIKHGDSDFRFILVNSDKTTGHQNFTICHELYHLYIQEQFESKICTVGTFSTKDAEEYNADVFASFFLLPSEAIRKYVPDTELAAKSVSLNTVVKIENLFGSSRLATLIRLRNLKLITDANYEDFQLHVKASASRFGHPPYLYEPSVSDSVVGDYGQLANELYDKELISENHFYSLMEDLGFSVESIELEDEA